MLRIPRRAGPSTPAMSPDAGIVKAVALKMAQERAMQVWRGHMRAIEATAQRALAALAVAADPRATPAQRREALGRASGYRQALTTQWEGTERKAKSEVRQVFKDLALGVGGGELASALGRIEESLRVPEAVAGLDEYFEDVVELQEKLANRRGQEQSRSEAPDRFPATWQAPTPFAS
ncbi:MULTISPECIES: hypothetical protein [unclassified Xanthobacter]|uniref:hypothetical protein n=1 Tax=unclassified Xanthobacter TaxID=2623496 RepID=UPI001F348692|nr:MULTISPECIES: hypothetical protein [unclassified Xanthobacter]